MVAHAYFFYHMYMYIYKSFMYMCVYVFKTAYVSIMVFMLYRVVAYLCAFLEVRLAPFRPFLANHISCSVNELNVHIALSAFISVFLYCISIYLYLCVSMSYVTGHALLMTI